MPSNHSRDTNLDHLHPAVRDACSKILADLAAASLPFELFEAFRTPERQAFLYAQGRTTPGPIVTKARPWGSYHQYGLAIDLVLKLNGQWSWSTSGAHKQSWDRMNAIGQQHGLEPLSWEKPHLQLAGLDIDDLKGGDFPTGGDATWAENLEAAIAGWSGSPAAPPPPEDAPHRPAIVEGSSEGSLLVVSDLPAIDAQGWHKRFGGREWKYNGNGVFLRDVQNGNAPVRSPGSPITCRAIWEAFGPIILVMSKKYAIAPELIMMTIATEAAAYRLEGFTGPSTFRWEAHVMNTDVSPPTQGDYSAGPMQTLGTTARWVIQAQGLPYHRFDVAPVFALRPIPSPATHPLYDATTNIEIGTAEIRQRWGTTGPDPILVAAAFNSGGVYESDANAWHLRTHGNHLDRAAQWFGDACAVLKEVGVR